MAETNPCAICLAGGGQATFTAECSHTFHFTCISASVTHGNLVCPLCNALTPVPLPPPPPVPAHFLQPRGLPFVRPKKVPPPVPAHDLSFVRPTRVPPPAPPVPAHFLQRRPYHVQPVFLVFDDDEQVEPASRIPHSQPATSNGAVVNTHTEWWVDAGEESSDNFHFAMHVLVKAPGMIGTDAAPRAPLDLVAVLDVSDSMSGEKLALLKQTMRFVVNNLGPDDRLSVVSFSSKARRVTRLARMTDDGKASCVGAVNSLMAWEKNILMEGGGTNIAEGLRTAAKVLDERRHQNAVSGVVLLSDGQDTYTMVGRRDGHEALVPPSFLRAGSAPIHTFGIGNDHDATAMHVIAEATGGTFSFIENEAVIQDAFAQCIGVRLSVAIQDARIAVACVHSGVRIVSVKSGRYESRVDEDGRAASIRVGELYAYEERRFLLFLAVLPTAEEPDSDNTALPKVVFIYRDAASGLDINVTADDAGVEQERAEERVRAEVAEDIAVARAAAERGAYQEAVKILENRHRVVAQSGDGDTVIVALAAELREMRVYARWDECARAEARDRVVCPAPQQDEATLAYATPAMWVEKTSEPVQKK